MHQIWVITDDKGKIQHCWEAPDPPDSENPERPPVGLDDVPPGWQVLKIPEPADFEEIKEAAREKKKSISRHIFDDFEVDLKTKKLKKLASRPEKNASIEGANRQVKDQP